VSVAVGTSAESFSAPWTRQFVCRSGEPRGLRRIWRRGYDIRNVGGRMVAGA
jgi:hypothetical protein